MICYLRRLWSGRLSTTIAHARAEEPWRARAYIDITTPGLFEATIPPEPVGEVHHTLTPDRVMLDQDQTLVWEAGIPERLDVKSLEVKIAGQNIIGRIDVEGLTQDGWTTVVRNAVVFKTTGCLGVRIDIPKNHYDKLRLRKRRRLAVEI